MQGIEPNVNYEAHKPFQTRCAGGVTNYPPHQAQTFRHEEPLPQMCAEKNLGSDPPWVAEVASSVQHNPAASILTDFVKIGV